MLLSVAGAVRLFAIGAGVRMHLPARDTDGLDDRDHDGAFGSANLLLSMATSLQVLVQIATGTVFIVWFHRVRRNGAVFRRDGFRRPSGWAVGAWFIPFGNLVIPYGIARDTWHAGTQRGPGGEHRRVSTVPLTAWWTLWVTSAVVDRVASKLYGASDTAEMLRTASVIGIAGDLLTLAAAVCAVLFVRKPTAMQHTMAVYGPHAAA